MGIRETRREDAAELAALGTSGRGGSERPVPADVRGCTLVLVLFSEGDGVPGKLDTCISNVDVDAALLGVEAVMGADGDVDCGGADAVTVVLGRATRVGAVEGTPAPDGNGEGTKVADGVSSSLMLSKS